MSEEGDDKLLGLLGKMMGNIARSAVENARLLQEVSGTRADTAATCLPSTERVPAVAPQAYPHLSATSVDQAFGVSDAVNGYSGNEKGKRGRKRKGGAEVRAAARPRTHGRGSRTPRPAPHDPTLRRVQGDAPKKKRAPSGYILYTSEQRSSMKEDGSATGMAQKELMKELASRWRDLPQTGKDEWNNKAKEGAAAADAASSSAAAAAVESLDDGEKKQKKKHKKARAVPRAHRPPLPT